MKSLLISLAIVCGAVLPIQAALNGKMGKAVGDPIYASLISFIVGSFGLLIYVLASKTPLSSITQATQVNWTVWSAGILGAFYVAFMIILAPKLGVSLTFGLVVTGQLSISLIIDHFGLLGIPIHHISWQRILGVLFIIAGVIMIRRF
ncbi:MAG: DMT family transporter [Bacteroidota bacterium]